MNKGVFLVMVGLSAVTMLAACEDPSASVQPSPVPLQSAADPNVRESASAAPDFDTGHTVHLTQVGIQPKALVSQCCSPIVFKNETSAAVSVTFDVSKKSSGPIAPGATWQWIPPNPESVVYHLGTNVAQRGSIQIESPNW